MNLESAILLAVTSHMGQTDRAGRPYILHPLRVMASMKTDETRMAAILHDVVEDTSVTMDQLRALGCPTAVLDALELLTKTPGESRLANARRLASNEVACRVKLADLADNMDLTRLPKITPADRARVREYMAVRDHILTVNYPFTV